MLNEIREALPHEDIIYFGDSAWCPYGPRHPEEIQRRVFAITDLLLKRGCKLIVIACNSATIAAVEALRATYPVPFIGMEPGVKPAVALTQSGVVGVLATEASLAGEKFHRLLDTHAAEVKVITRPAPHFVTLVEKGELTGARVRRIVEEETLPLIEAGADVIVLGCTHYPFLRPIIEEVVGEQVYILDTGKAVARHVAKTLGEISQKPESPTCHIITSGDLAHVQGLFPLLCPDTKASFEVY